MIFPEEWGPPPAYGFVEVSAEGEMRRLSDDGKKKNELNSSSSVCENSGNANGALHAHAKNEGPNLCFYTVEGCPSASNDLLVKEGEYEGGFSIWECTWDLLGFLQKNKNIENAVKNKHVIELGCGHGLLGIWALQKNASAVVFQDLNHKVLESATRWNILKNVKKPIEGEKMDFCELSLTAEENGVNEDDLKSVIKSKNEKNEEKREMVLLGGRALCLSAEWEKMPHFFCKKKCKKIKFEILFCAEGIYREQSFMPLTKSIIQLLSDHGFALIASKRYYFGIGGGSLSFIKFIESNFSQELIVEIACTFRSPTSNNFRDILLIRKKPKT